MHFHLDFHTWFAKDDLYSALYGLTSGDFDQYGNETHSHYIQDALYYLPSRPMMNVSRVLMMQDGEFTYFCNYSNINRLNDENKGLLLNLQHPHEWI